jgi:hypothetical protein
VIKVSGKIPSDVGRDKSKNTDREAVGASEYRNQEGRDDDATYK